MNPLLTRRNTLALAGAGAFAPAAFAQGTFPDRAVNMIVPFAPGGTPDIAARLMAPKMAELLGQAVTVENRAGAGATIGTRAVVQARPDGHTILMGSISFLTAPLTADPMPYDPVAQLRVISLISTSPYVLIVRADSPAKDIAGFHAWTRERGNKLNYGSSGSGTPLHLGGELYKLMMGVDLTHVAYRGSGPAITALIAGEVDMVFADVPGASGQIRAGTVRPLATMVRERIKQLPDVPTMAESDPRLKDYDVYTWAMLVAPKATPDRAVQRLHDVAIGAARQPDVMKRFEEMGFDYVGSSPADGDKRLEAERDKWRAVIKRANIKVDL